MSKHRYYDPAFKANVVLKALQGQKTKAQISREYDIATSLLTYWMEKFVERSPQLFIMKRGSIEKQMHIAEIERIVGELNSELTALKNYESIYQSPEKRTP